MLNTQSDASGQELFEGDFVVYVTPGSYRKLEHGVIESFTPKGVRLHALSWAIIRKDFGGGGDITPNWGDTEHLARPFGLVHKFTPTDEWLDGQTKLAYEKLMRYTNA